MKFYVILLVTYKDETADKVGIYNFETEDKALKGFYQYMSQYVDVENVATVNVECKSNLGVILKNDTWQNDGSVVAE